MEVISLFLSVSVSSRDLSLSLSTVTLTNSLSICLKLLLLLHDTVFRSLLSIDRLMESKLINLSVECDEESFVQHHHEKVLVVKNDDGLSVEDESFVQHYEKVVALVNKNDDILITWADLPSDILGTVFSLLFEFDHLSFRLTCKAWQQSSVRCPSISSSSIQKFPWLMCHAKPQSHGVFSFFNPLLNLTYVMKIPKLAGTYFRCSRFGWLLMLSGCHSLFFYNPFIPDSTIKIPDFIRDVEFVSMSFTAPPTSPDCIVFGHELSLGDRVVIHRWGYGEDKWTEYMIDCQAPFYTTLCTPFFYKDVFYHLDINGRLGVLDPNNNHQKLTWNDLTQPIARNDVFVRRHTKNYVAECDGQCVLVFVGNKGHPIHVFELDWSQMEWVTLQSLGNKTMFIGETGSLLINTRVSGAENKIYFSRFVNTKGYCKSTTDAGNGIFYCLETCKYHAFESKFSGEDWLGTRGLSKFVWFEPNFECADWFRFFEEDVCPPPMPKEDEQEKDDDHADESDDDDDDEEEEEEAVAEEEEEEEERPASSVFVPTTDCPYLVFHHGKRNSKQTFFSILEEKYWVTSVVPEMSGMICCASSHGWLVILDNYSTRCFLLNPVSMEKVELPPMKMTSSYRKVDHCVLTSSPPDNNCVVMFVSYEHVACLFCRPNDQNWTRKTLGSKPIYDSYSDFRYINAVVSSKGKIYIAFFYGASIKVLDTTMDDDGVARNNTTTFMVEKIIVENENTPAEQWQRFAPGVVLSYLVESCEDKYSQS